MTRRVVLFKGQTSWMQTPEFVGDKDELMKESTTLSCDKNWPQIARIFIQSKTKDEFSAASLQVQGLYHDTMAKNRLEKLRLFKQPDDTLDETLVVYEDLGVTGIQAVGTCPVCGRTHLIWYRPDKTISSTMQCLTCGARLRVLDPLPTKEEWAEAIDMYKKPTPSYRLATPDDFPHITQKLKEYAEKKQEVLTEKQLAGAASEWLKDEIKNDIAAKHLGDPVKILKIVQYTGGEFRYEIMFRDWSTAILRRRYLISLNKD